MPTNIWTYAGQAGKRLNATVRPFNGDGGNLLFASMDVDRWTWAVPLKEFVPSDEEYPEEGQLVTLYRSGQRFFHGTALRPDRNGYVMNLEIVSPWHWLEKIPLTTAVTLDVASGGGAGVRTTIGFPAQSMTTSLGALIDRCIALGAPMIKGTIPTTFSCIPYTLNNGSCADAIAELCRLIGDMAVSFDYTGSGHPIINITRRRAGLAVGSMADVSIDSADFSPGRFKVVPMDEQRVSMVRVPFIDRASNGTRRLQEQKAGVDELGHVLILTASGEELDTFLPEEKLDSYVLQTVPTTGTPFRNWVINQDSDFIKAFPPGGMAPSMLPVVIGPTSFQYQTRSEYLPALNKTVPIVGTEFVNKAGQAVSTVGKEILISSNLPEWLKDQSGYTVEEARAVGVIAYEFNSQTFGTGAGTHTIFSWWFEIGWNRQDAGGFRGTSTNFSAYQLFMHHFDVPVYLINTSAPGGSTIYRQPDYTFISPPAGFANGLLQARNWLPYRGVVGWMEQDCGSTRYLGKAINITGADPEFESMRAMVATEELDLARGVTTLELGPPQRHAFRELTQAVRANSNKQIAYL